MADNTEIDQSESQAMIDMAKKNAKLLKKNVLGSDEVNETYSKKQKAAAEKYPDSAEAKVEKIKKTFGMRKGGSVGSASKRADGCAQRGKTKGRML